jgi:hypothetical protein
MTYMVADGSEPGLPARDRAAFRRHNGQVECVIMVSGDSLQHVCLGPLAEPCD